MPNFLTRSIRFVVSAIASLTPARLAAAEPRARADDFLLRRLHFEEGDTLGQRLANGRDRTIAALGRGKGGRALCVRLSANSNPTPRRKRSFRACFCILSVRPEDGQTYVVKLRMRTDFPPGGRFYFGIDQKGKKDGKMEYFRAKYPDPAFARTRRIAVRHDWKEYSWEFRPAPSTETGCETACLVYCTVDGPAGTAAWIDDVELWQKPVFYETGFDGESEGATGWTRSGRGAVLDRGAGHGAAGSLKIHAGGKTKRSPYWESPYIPVPDPDVFLSCWIRDSLTFSPDPTYNVNAELLCYRGDRKLIRRLPELVSVWKGYAPDVGNSLLGGRLSSTCWHYLTKKTLLPPQTRLVKIRFGFRHSYHGDDVATTGDAWLDDVALASGRAMARDNCQEPYREHAWPVWDNRNMRIHAPVFMNLFLPQDRLTMDAIVLSNAKELRDQTDVTLEYRVEDFFHTALLTERIGNPGLQPVPAPRLKAAGADPRLFDGACWKQIVLPPSLSTSETGRWLRLHCRVLKDGRTIAEGNTNFGVLRPAAPVSEERKDASKFAVELGPFSPSWGKCPPAAGVVPRPTYAELFGFHWKRAGYVNAWRSAQPEKGGPIDWDRLGVERSFKTGQLKRGVNNRAYIWFNSVLPHCRPQWANLPGVPVSRDSLDPDAFAQWVRAVVGRYRGAGIMWMPGLSETAINDKQARLARVGYEAAKDADPGAVVFCSGVTGISVERMKEYFELRHLDFTDALDLHFYYDPYATEKTLDYVREEMASRGQVKPMWSAEIGSFCRDFETLCKDMVKKHVIAFACGMRNVCWHAFGRPQTRKVNPMWRFSYRFPEGKLASAFPVDVNVPRCYEVPLPRLFTLNNLLRDLDYVEPRNKLVTKDGVRVYVFDREPPGGRAGEKKTVIAVWQPDGQGSLALAVKEPVTVSDTFGMRHDLKPGRTGRVFMPVNDNPRIITTAGQLDEVSFSDGPISVEAPATIDGPGLIAVRVTITSRDRQPIEGTVSANAGADWRVDPPEATAGLPMDKSRVLTFKLSPPRGLKPGKHRLLIHLTDRDGRLTGYDERYLRLSP